MTKHFQEERCSCFIGEHQYTLKQLVEMEEGELPKLPPEYESLIYLNTKLGDIETVNCVCFIWNRKHSGDTLRVKSADEYTGEIVLTGKCQDPDMAMKVSKWLTTFGVTWFRYEKTILEIEI